MTKLLIGYGVDQKEAQTVVNEIHTVNKTAHLISLVAHDNGEISEITGIDRISVTRLLEPTESFGGITDPVTRAQAACETLRTYIAEMSSTKFAAWVGIMMYVGDEQLVAAEWLRDHGYFEDPLSIN